MELDKVFHERTRLRIMTILMATEEHVTFTYMANTLKLTRGNLGAHMRKLEEHGYVQSKKSFINRIPRTTYRLTKRGKSAFQDYIETLEQIIQEVKK